MTDPRAPLFDYARKLSLRAPGPLNAADVAAINHELDILGAAAASQGVSAAAGSVAPPVVQTHAAGRKTGENGRKLIQSFEQCRLTGYLPTPNDVPTIGWGSTGPGIKVGDVWTQQQADDRFAADLGRFETAVSNAIGNAPTTQNQFDAMVSLAYNIGGAGFIGSTVARKHKAGDHAGAADAFLLWNKQKGIELRGLTRRREAERLLYLDGSA